jgi:hypothetical protein
VITIYFRTFPKNGPAKPLLVIGQSRVFPSFSWKSPYKGEEGGGLITLVFKYTVILSISKRERERFPLFVPMRNCVSARTFLGVPNRSALQPFTALERLHERFHLFLTFL